MPRVTFNCTFAISFILLALGIGHLTPAQSLHPTGDRSSIEITQVLTRQQSAWNAGDIPSFMNGYWNSPELSFSGSNGVSRGWQAVLVRYQHNYPDKSAMGHLDFSDLEIHSLSDSAALVLGKWHLKRDSGDVGGVFTLVFQRFPDGWKIIHDHTSQVPPQKP